MCGRKTGLRRERCNRQESRGLRFLDIRVVRLKSNGHLPRKDRDGSFSVRSQLEHGLDDWGPAEGVVSTCHRWVPAFEDVPGRTRVLASRDLRGGPAKPPGSLLGGRHPAQALCDRISPVVVPCQNSVRRLEAGELVHPQGGQGSSGVTMSDVKEEERNGQPARIPLPPGAS